ncbi:MAG: Polyketide cyclase / dehydrase and lipid transport [Actinomycetota bacterium]
MSVEPRFRGQASLLIDAPARSVFDLVTDVSRLPDWNSCIDRVVEQPASLQEGAEWLVVIHVPHLPKWKSRSTCQHIDREALRFVYKSTSEDKNPSFIDWFWEVTDRGGRAEVTVRWHGYPLTRFRQKIAAPLRSRQLERETRASLDALASCVRSTTVR